MSGKNKNSRIVFLTTLSVYLGLVLVGAPTVLAQAATTKNFDVQTEIEIKDDLDNKPDDEKSSEKDLPSLFIELLNELRQAVKDGKVALPLPAEFGAAGDFEIVASGIGSGGAVGANVTDRQLEEILRGAVGTRFYRKAAALGDFGKDGYKSVRIHLSADVDDLTLRVSFTKNKAERFAKVASREFSVIAASVKHKTVKQVYENTEVIVQNNQVSIVTRLPRGSLDALFKQDAKVGGK